MDSRERMLCALAGGTPDRVPFGETSIDPVVAQRIAGANHPLSELEITELLGRDIVPLEAFPPIFADEVRSSKGQAFFDRPWIASEADLERIEWPDPLGEAFQAAATEAVRRRGPYATVAMVRLGISATYISMGFEPFCLALLANPGFVQEVMRRYTEWTARRIEFMQEIGFDVIWSFDDIAYNSGLMFSPQTLREVILPVVKPTIARIEVPWVFHSDGDLMSFMDELLQLGMQGLNPLEPGSMDIREVKQKYGSRLCLLGNVNVDTLSRGTPEEVEQEVLDLLRDVAPGGGFVMATSNSAPNYAIPENVAAMARALQRYGAYPIAF